MAEQSLYKFVDFAKGFTPSSGSISVIFELGARDCVETLELHALIPEARIFTFECNPNTLTQCRTNIAGIENIHLIEKAVANKEGTLKFYPINKEKTRTTREDGNQGASSLFRASGKYPVEDYIQDEVEVDTTTIEREMQANKVNHIDLLWMDIQGAELLALKGAKKGLRKIKFIHLEVEFMEIYAGQPLFKKIKQYLNHRGFLLCGFTNFGEYSADAIFVNRTLMTASEWVKYALKDALLYSWYKHKLRDVINSKIHTIKSAARRQGARLSSSFKKPTGFVGDHFSRLRKKYLQLAVGERPMFSLKRFLFFVWLRKFKTSLRLDPNGTEVEPSKTPLDVVIPAVEKDFVVLPYTIEGLRKNLAHPIGNVFVISPYSKAIKQLCQKHSCHFIDENLVTPIKRTEIDYISKGIDRSGWLLQQLIKLNSDTIVKTENFLVIDADTVLTKPQVMIYKQRTVFNHSEEYHGPYFTVYTKLLGTKPKSCLSFVAHYMVFNQKVLAELKQALEDRSDESWHTAILHAIDKTEFSAFSEYETYGNFYLSRHRPIRAYWFNQTLTSSDLQPVEQLVHPAGKLKSISFHAHEKI